MKNVYTVSNEINALAQSMDYVDDPAERKRIFARRKELQAELLVLQAQYLKRKRKVH